MKFDRASIHRRFHIERADMSEAQSLDDSLDCRDEGRFLRQLMANRSKAVQPAKSKAVSNIWKWRDRHGNFHAPTSMETRHLFYVVRMIWNHTMPANAKIHPYNHYDFGDFYTKEYMLTAVRSCVTELGGRDNLTGAMRRDLKHMISHFNSSEFVKLNSQNAITLRISAS